MRRAILLLLASLLCTAQLQSKEDLLQMLQEREEYKDLSKNELKNLQELNLSGYNSTDLLTSIGEFKNLKI
ncbi:MAG: hypothetical protein AAF518_29160, partial [Spirochaetota bacterium]